MRYVQRFDGEGFSVKSGVRHKIACCDCGLVHVFVFVSECGGRIGIAARRDERATKARRKRKSNAEARAI
jgi:hypothetical protein